MEDHKQEGWPEIALSTSVCEQNEGDESGAHLTDIGEQKDKATHGIGPKAQGSVFLD